MRYGCRCKTCKAANTARGNAQRRARTARGVKDPTLVPHGTPGGYSNWGCHCDECTKANTDYCGERRRIRKERLLNEPDTT
jgi:hypothetical protein